MAAAEPASSRVVTAQVASRAIQPVTNRLRDCSRRAASNAQTVAAIEVIHSEKANVGPEEVYRANFKDYEAEASQIRQILERHNSAGESLLDVGCGTGVHLSHLSSHYKTTGVDLDETMLERKVVATVR